MSSSRASGATSRSPNVRGTKARPSPLMQSTRKLAGGDSTSQTNWRAITATNQLRSKKLRAQSTNASLRKELRPKTARTPNAVVNGHGIVQPTHEGSRNVSASSARQSTWAPHPAERSGLLQPSWLTKLPSQMRNLPAERPSVLPGRHEKNEEPSEQKWRPPLIQQTQSTIQLGTWKTDERLTRMLDRDETLISDEVRAVLGEELRSRSFVLRRRGLMAKTTTRAVAYSASEVYRVRKLTIGGRGLG